MIATDPLSLVFLGCVVFAGTFLLISSLTGTGHGHALHLGHAVHPVHAVHAGHAGTIGHAGVGHAGAAHGPEVGHAVASHAGGAPGAGAHQSGVPISLAAAWGTAYSVLLGSLNVFSLLTFLFFFGLLGYLFHNATNLGVVLSVLLPALIGLAGAIAVGMVLTRLFANETGLLTAADTSLEGRIGKVSLAIRPGGVGEVIFQRPGGGRQSIGARGVDGTAIQVDAEIVIVSVTDGIANVQAWDSFLRGVRGGHAPPAAAIEPETPTITRDAIQPGKEVVPGQER
ncbi:MAG: hypothetical protein PVSMB4_17380 [Ktedonobacterales bacterium]